MRNYIVLVSISGGKDSQASGNKILKKCKRVPVVFYFADTGWEAPETYEHLDYLEKVWGKKIHRIKSKKYDGFEDMCIQRKAFPSRVRRFCTEELKLVPSTEFIKEYKNKGFKVINVVGVRADESKSQKLKEPKVINGVKWWLTPKRSIENKWKCTFLGLLPKATKRKDGSYSYPKKAKEYYCEKNAVLTYQPVVYWSERDVYKYNISSGTRNNPLYSKGYTRVGCFPCINANVNEIGMLTKDRVEKINKLEKDVQATTTKTKPVFFHKGGKLTAFSDVFNKYERNTLGFDLGCINHLGICE